MHWMHWPSYDGSRTACGIELEPGNLGDRMRAIKGAEAVPGTAVWHTVSVDPYCTVDVCYDCVEARRRVRGRLVNGPKPLTSKTGRKVRVGM